MRKRAGEGQTQPFGSSPNGGKASEQTSKPAFEREGSTTECSTVAHSTDSSGLTLSEQTPIGAAATVELDGRPPSEVWAELSSSDTFQGELVRAVLDAGRGRTYLEYHDLLEGAEIDALHGSFRSLVLGVAQGNESALWSFLREMRQIGTGHSEINDAVDVVSLFALALESRPEREIPTVAFSVKPEFEDQKASQRRTICAIITELSRGCDVQVAGDSRTCSWLIDRHREDLPVSSESDTPRDLGPLAKRIRAAVGVLNPDSREAKILRLLSNESTGTLSYHSAYSAFHVDDSRVRQCINRLAELGLVNTFGPLTNRKFELLEAGRKYLSEVTRQITLDDTPPNTYHETTCNMPNEMRGKNSQAYRTTYQDHADKTTAGALGLDNDIALVSEAVELDQTEQERKTKRVDYDEKRGVATVSVRAGEGLPLLVSMATALAKPWFLAKTLPDSRIEAIDEPASILRGGRNIGGLSDQALDNPEELRTTLVEWGDDLGRLSTKFSHATGDDKKDLASEIMRSSQGLIGSVVHLLDAAGTDVVREIRVPSGRPLHRLENLSESIARSAVIQSKYGVFAPYRHIVKTDAGKPPISPEVNAADPCGSLIGSFVIRGKDVHRLRGPLETALSSPGEFLDEQPEFTVPITVREADRPEFATTATRVLKSKNLRPTCEAVSLVHALTGSPYDAARALNQLKVEDTVRNVRPDEIRYALATLEADRILPDHTPTVGKVVYELLQATAPLSQAALAEKAGVSTQSIRNNRDALEALGIISTERGAWRLNLSFRTKAERRNAVVPTFVGGEFVDAVSALLETVLPPEQFGDPDDERGGVLFWPPDPWRLLDDVELSAWIKLAAALTGTERPESETTISVGPEINQTAITDTEAIV